MFLRKNVADIIEERKEQDYSNAKILKEALEEGTNLNVLLQEDFDNEIDNLMECLLKGYEIDEKDEYEKIGLLNHPYLLADWTKHAPTFIIFYLEHENFTGSIWLPYYSKPDYGANLSFTYEGDRYPTGNSRIAELEKAPQWFQELFQRCNQYIKERNNVILSEIDEIFEELYEDIKNDENFSYEIHRKEGHPSLDEFWNYRYTIVPSILKKLMETDDQLLCQILEDLTYIKWNFETHDEREELEEYETAAKEFSTWKEYWLNWGKSREWI